LRPDICPGSTSWGLSSDFPYAGVILNITVGLDGLFFDGSTATEKHKRSTYDNPFT